MYSYLLFYFGSLSTHVPCIEFNFLCVIPDRFSPGFVPLCVYCPSLHLTFVLVLPGFSPAEVLVFFCCSCEQSALKLDFEFLSAEPISYLPCSHTLTHDA